MNIIGNSLIAYLYSSHQHCFLIMKVSLIIATLLSLYSISFLVYGSTSLTVSAQSDLQTTKSRNLIIDLGNGIKTNAQLTYPAISGKYHYLNL